RLARIDWQWRQVAWMATTISTSQPTSAKTPVLEAMRTFWGGVVSCLRIERRLFWYMAKIVVGVLVWLLRARRSNGIQHRQTIVVGAEYRADRKLHLLHGDPRRSTARYWCRVSRRQIAARGPRPCTLTGQPRPSA